MDDRWYQNIHDLLTGKRLCLFQNPSETIRIHELHVFSLVNSDKLNHKTQQRRRYHSTDIRNWTFTWWHYRCLNCEYSRASSFSFDTFMILNYQILEHNNMEDICILYSTFYILYSADYMMYDAQFMCRVPHIILHSKNRKNPDNNRIKKVLWLTKHWN
jgi:hypothetical protein